MNPHRVFTVEELERALAGAEVGVWSWDIATDRVRWSEQTERIFGVPAGTFGETLAGYLSHVHPDDVTATREAIERAITLKDRAFRLAHRAIRPGGSILGSSPAGAVLHDASGRVVGMLGTIADCTEAKRNEEQIGGNEEMYRLLAELSSDWVYRADLTKPSMVPEIVVGSFERTTGYPPEEIEKIGGWLSVVHPDDLRNFDALIPELSSGHPTVNEYRIRDKHGEIRWLRDRAGRFSTPKHMP